MFAKHQLHRALFHNVFFAGLIYFFNQYLGIGVLLHILLDMLTSPTDRGIEPLFPLGRLVKEFQFDYDGKIRKIESKIGWYLEDPIRLIRKTADPGLKSPEKYPWIRIYGPFKNSRLADWTIFYASIIFIVLYENVNFLSWFLSFLYFVFVKYVIVATGIVIFYTAGELWRRKFQFTGKGKPIIVTLMTVGVIMILFQGYFLYQPPAISTSQVQTAILSVASLIIGLVVGYIHVKKRHGEVVL